MAFFSGGASEPTGPVRVRANCSPVPSLRAAGWGPPVRGRAGGAAGSGFLRPRVERIWSKKPDFWLESSAMRRLERRKAPFLGPLSHTRSSEHRHLR
ncbi:hypothetical protein D3C87_1925720 [compost metagenome]